MTNNDSLWTNLHEQLVSANYTLDGIHSLLGDTTFSALFRHEPVPVHLVTGPILESSRDTEHGEEQPYRLAWFIEFFLLGSVMPSCEVTHHLGWTDEQLAEALTHGLLDNVIVDSVSGIRTRIDVRPIDTGFGDEWMVSDPDGALFPYPTKDDHVLGVGEASLSLLRATPLSSVDTLLDIGTGCGIQAIHGAHYAQRVVATDLSPRCCALAAATAEINGVSSRIDIRQGSWFDPVADEKFDAIVANPPFVVSSTNVTHSYRDSGLDLDGATELMVRTAPNHLKCGGRATMLGAWVHSDDEDYRSRLTSWLPDHGVDAWIVQRDCVDPALYVSTWMRDSHRDPADPVHAQHAQQWLDHFTEHGVSGIGFGMIFLRKTAEDAPSTLIVEELTDSAGDSLAQESLERWERWDKLQHWSVEELMEQRFYLAPTTVIGKSEIPDSSGQGVVTETITIGRTDMPSFRHEIDSTLYTLLRGISAEGLDIGSIAELLATIEGWDCEAITPALAQSIKDLYLHGIILT